MARKTRAKFRCNTVTRKRGPQEVVELSAVTDTDPAGEDSGFADATPIGEIEITIDNEAALGAFEPGEKFYVDFIPEDAE